MKAAGFDSTQGLKYIGVAIGEEHRLWRLVRLLEDRFSGVAHLRELPSSHMRKLAANMILKTKHEFICLHVDLKWIINQVRTAFPRYPEKGIRKHVGEALWPTISHILDSHEVYKIYLCKDVEWIFRGKTEFEIGGLSCLADAVAWANLRKPPSIDYSRLKEIRLRENLKKTVISKLKEKA